MSLDTVVLIALVLYVLTRPISAARIAGGVTIGAAGIAAIILFFHFLNWVNSS